MSRHNKPRHGRAYIAALIVIFISVSVSTFRSEMSMVNHIAVVTSSSHAG